MHSWNSAILLTFKSLANSSVGGSSGLFVYQCFCAAVHMRYKWYFVTLTVMQWDVLLQIRMQYMLNNVIPCLQYVWSMYKWWDQIMVPCGTVTPFLQQKNNSWNQNSFSVRKWTKTAVFADTGWKCGFREVLTKTRVLNVEILTICCGIYRSNITVFFCVFDCSCISANGDKKRFVTMSVKDVMPPRDAGKYIAEHSLDVSVSLDGVKKTAKKACYDVNWCFVFTRATLC